MWYRAHYSEAEKIRARPLGKYFLQFFQVYGGSRICLIKEAKIRIFLD